MSIESRSAEIKAQLNAEDVQKEFEAVVAVQGEVAEKLLEQNGWSIIRQLFGACAQHLVTTRGFIEPAMAGFESFKDKLEDPIAFQKNLQTLVADLSAMAEALQVASSRHVGKEGAPTAEELPLVGELTLAYSQVQSQLELSVDPLIFSMIDTMKAAGIDSFEVAQESV